MAQPRYPRQSRCRLERLNTLRPTRRVQSEAGETEFFQDKTDQLRCAGVSVYRRRIKHRSGIAGYLIPGCPETFQYFQKGAGSEKEKSEYEFRQGHGQGHGKQSFRDKHQKIRAFRQGDILVIPAGVAFWAYNNGKAPLETITVADTSSRFNQLDNDHRQFQLAGSQRGVGESKNSSNILRAFKTESLAESLGASRGLAEKIQKEDSRGEIVTVKEGLDLAWPFAGKGEEDEPERKREEEQGGSRGGKQSNGVEEIFCSSRLIENIDNPRQADVYNPLAGRITEINSLKLHSLRYIKLSAVRGVLRKKTIVAPHWNLNSHSLVYVTSGSAFVEVADDEGKLVFGEKLQQGQLLFIPQNYVVLKRAGEDGFEFISFKTNDNPLFSQFNGKSSILKGLPKDVVATSYRISWEEAKQLKYARADQLALFQESSQEQQHRSLNIGAAAIRELLNQ
ncbi:Glutelin type-A 3 [Platanthera zijinensis]|uniref:Glutelin type-A 3 n=1 Tax=Platanthera zijinensis TaxID=2320716 RepID=A0AAP0C270_9ASPA